MTPYKQLYGHNPDQGIFGDCFRTALGCLLNMPPEKVPHFYDGCRPEDDATEQNKAVQYWLAQQGYRLVIIPYECSPETLLESQGFNNPDTYWLMSGKSGKHDCNHVVICCGNQVIWDPSRENSGVTGKNKDGQVWCEYLIPISMTANAEELEIIEQVKRHALSS